MRIRSSNKITSYLMFLLPLAFVVVGIAFIIFKQSEVNNIQSLVAPFTIISPDGFVRNETIDGVYAYTEIFTKNKNSFSVSFSKNESMINNTELMKEVRSIAAVSDIKTVSVDGASGVEEFEDHSKSTNGDPGCDLSTYFEKNGKSYEISLFSSDCAYVAGMRTAYEASGQSFKNQ